MTMWRVTARCRGCDALMGPIDVSTALVSGKQRIRTACLLDPAEHARVEDANVKARAEMAKVAQLVVERARIEDHAETCTRDELSARKPWLVSLSLMVDNFEHPGAEGAELFLEAIEEQLMLPTVADIEAAHGGETRRGRRGEERGSGGR